MTQSLSEKKRDDSLDIAKGILIILMMIGHMDISLGLRAVIYSFHMAAFIFYSGYCFKGKAVENIKAATLNLAKTFLVPYVIWAVFYIVMKNDGLMNQLKNILCGVSSVNKIFTERVTVGQVYFLLLLFLVRFIYLWLFKYTKNDSIRSIVIVILSLVGANLGKFGYWLPWSFDCVLYALVFYHAGYLVKKRNVLSWLHEHKIYYHVLAVLWLLAIYSGGMSFYIREYGNYLITVAGAVSASIFLYIGCHVVDSYLPKKYRNVLVDIGKNTLSILLLHTIFGGYIAIFTVKIFMEVGLEHWFLPIYLIVLLVQIILGILWGRIYEKVFKTFL